MTTKDEQLAFTAGKAMSSEPSERHGVEACPFEEGTAERAAWLRGYQEILDQQPDTASLTKDLEDAIKLEDDVHA